VTGEPATARPLPCLIHIQGEDYVWTEEDGLDPAAVLTLRRFIWREAKRYASVGLRSGLSLEDLAQEGQHGALVAARRFDPTKGLRFITYAVWWIRARILDALRKHMVYVPKEVARALRQDGGLPPVCSLDLPLFADGTTLGQCLAGEFDQTTTEAPVMALEVRRLVRRLKPRDQHILVRHYGLDGQPAETLAAIAITLGLSRERVRQLESQALAQLRKVIAFKG
jgi:RNA polymerase sigma factor (sigma-70 family)